MTPEELTTKETVCLTKETFDQVLMYMRQRANAGAWHNDQWCWKLFRQIELETGERLT